MTRSVWRWIKWLSVSLIGFITLILLAVVCLTFTNLGLSALLWVGEKALPSLSVASHSGALFPRFTLSDVRYNDKDLKLDIDVGELTLANDFRCLLTPQLCVNALQLNRVTVSLPHLPASQDEPAPNQTSTSFSLPLPIALNGVSLNQVSLNILGNQVRWAQFHTGVTLAGSKLTIAPTQWQSLEVKPAVASSTSSDNTAESESAANAVNTERTPITLPTVDLPLDIELQGFELQNAKVILATGNDANKAPSSATKTTGKSNAKSSANTPLEIERLELKAHTEQRKVTVEQLTLAMPTLNASLQGDVTLEGDYPLSLSLTADTTQAPLTQQSLTLTASQSVASLAVSSQWQGDVDAMLDATLSPLEPSLPFAFELSDGAGQWPLTGTPEYQFSQTDLKANGSLQGYQFALDAQLAGASIPSIHSVLKGEGTLTNVNLTTLMLNTLGGDISGSANADWQELAKWQASLAFRDLEPGLQWPEAEGKLSGQVQTQGHLTDKGGWWVNLPKLDVDGVLRDYPLNVSGKLMIEQPTRDSDIALTTEKLVLSHGPNRISAHGRLNQTWALDLDIDIADLSKSVPNAKGVARGALNLTGPFATPTAQVDFKAQQLAYQALTAASLGLKGTVALSDDPQGELTLDATRFGEGERQFDSLKVTLTGKQSQQTLDATLVSNWLSSELNIQGGLRLKPQAQWQGALSSMQVTTQQGRWQLAQATPIRVDLETNEVDIRGHCWQQAQSSICLGDMVSIGQTGDISAKINQFNFDQISEFIPKQTQVKGEVSATLRAKWAPKRSPFVSASIRLPKGSVTQELNTPISVGWDSIALNAQLQNDKLTADWQLDFTNNGDLSGQAQLSDVNSDDPQMTGTLRLSQFDLTFLRPLIGEYSELDGQLQSDIRFSGDVLHPQLFGDISLSNMVLKGEVTPIDINSGQMTLKLNQYQAQLSSDIVTPEGSLSVTGTGDWQDLAAWHSQIRVYANQLEVSMPPTIAIWVEPDMTIDIKPHEASIDGKIVVPKGSIVIEQLPESAVSVSKDQVLVNAKLQPIDEQNAIPFTVKTNVTLTIDEAFKLSAFGLKGNLAGTLSLTERDNGPFVSGEVNVLNGTYTSFGQDLVIQEGKVLLNGPVDQPYVSITAIRNPENTEDDVTAGIKVTGLATDPTITIFSEPAMPQANALSYLLRGQNIGADSGGSDAMTSMLIGLSLAQSGKLVGNIGKAFGVSDLQLGTVGSGDDSTVEVSGYIAPGLQVKYGVGIFKPVGEFTVRYQLFRDFYIEAVSGLDSALDLLYQFEFN
ncbi:translocation/assembly module TamB [Vibrio sp. SM6]|uniref:Translocation/assembly module TamB n=1 Tax=Vibrio agarilyticus TaxID=2726741 RepID=A0A7X8TPL7_9VIBR|nr:translocation/assembly module TamB domain-containing protein [Vibrio agarilyticus]NLS12420.1 translocation/assembly module TamB [Vibrio agarilyticus]